jgi:hypothetical protein
MGHKLRLYFFTIRYLTFIQVFYRIYYLLRTRARKIISFSYPKRIVPVGIQLKLEKSLSAAPSVKYQKGTFTFLNLEQTYSSSIDWNDSTHGKLWTYNLNYFEFLHTPTISKNEGINLILNFIDNIDQSKDGLEPYPISLRVIHWVKFLVFHEVKNKTINESLYHQLWTLADQREYHILGNHLLENGFGLLFGAYYFNDNDLYQLAKKILEPELNEQILKDGAHFELSPMYHQLMLYRVLDCYNLVLHNSGFDQELLLLFKDKAQIMLGWLEQMSFEDGAIPLFNDSALGINPSTKELTRYANRLGIQPIKKPLKESGYRKVHFPAYECIVDIGQIGPDYLPGHAHSDTFNFALHAKGKSFIVDTGTSTYNPTERRQLERGTAAHNTVQIDEQEQSEIWGSFRVARRAYPKIIQDKPHLIEAELNYSTSKNLTHHRFFSFAPNEIIIHDNIRAKEQGKAYIHFHPSVTPRIEGNCVHTHLGEIQIRGAEKIALSNYEYASGFNNLTSSQKLVVFFNKNLTTTISF